MGDLYTCYTSTEYLGDWGRGTVSLKSAWVNVESPKTWDTQWNDIKKEKTRADRDLCRQRKASRMTSWVGFCFPSIINRCIFFGRMGNFILKSPMQWSISTYVKTPPFPFVWGKWVLQSGMATTWQRLSHAGTSWFHCESSDKSTYGAWKLETVTSRRNCPLAGTPLWWLFSLHLVSRLKPYLPLVPTSS